MSAPTLLLGSVIAILIGAIFHLWRGGKGGRLLLYITLSMVGFWAGHFIASKLSWDIDKLGQLHLGFSILGSLIFLLIGYWLSLIDQSSM